MSRAKPPKFREILAIQLAAKIRSRWQRRNVKLDEMHSNLCKARALLAQALGLTLDPDTDLCACCADGEPPEAADLNEAARKALDLLTLAFAGSMTAEELLSEVNQTKSQLELLQLPE
jgi:hypothetical protein